MKYQVILFPYGDQIHTQHKYHAILLRRQRYLNKVEINLNVLEILESQHCHSAPQNTLEIGTKRSRMAGF